MERGFLHVCVKEEKNNTGQKQRWSNCLAQCRCQTVGFRQSWPTWTWVAVALPVLAGVCVCQCAFSPSSGWWPTISNTFISVCIISDMLGWFLMPISRPDLDSGEMYGRVVNKCLKLIVVGFYLNYKIPKSVKKGSNVLC